MPSTRFESRLSPSIPFHEPNVALGLGLGLGLGLELGLGLAVSVNSFSRTSFHVEGD